MNFEARNIKSPTHVTSHVKFSCSLTHVHHESCDLPGCYFFRREMLAIYHENTNVGSTKIVGTELRTSH
jgi:hypothetical protein